MTRKSVLFALIAALAAGVCTAQSPFTEAFPANGLRIKERGGDYKHWSIFLGGVMTANVTYTLPTAAPTVSGQALTATTAGVMSWAAPAPAAHNIFSLNHGDTSGAASPVLGDLIYGNATPKWEKLPGNATTTNKFLTQTGTGAVSAAPGWATIALGDLPDSATQYQMLQSGGAGGNPAWGTAAWPATTTANNVLYSSAANTVAELATANLGVLATSAAGVPSIDTTPEISGIVTLGVDNAGGVANTPGQLKLWSASDDAFFTTFQGGAQTQAVTYTLPTSDAAGAMLSDGAGTLSWGAVPLASITDGAVQYVPLVAGGASADPTWSDIIHIQQIYGVTNTLEVAAADGDSILMDDGATLNLYSGTSGSGATGNGGLIDMRAGNSVATDGDGGEIDIFAGDGAGTGSGGDMVIKAGAGGSGATGDGGNVTLYGGVAQSTDGSGGDVGIAAGAATGTGTGGLLRLTSGASGGASGAAGAVEIDTGDATGGTGAAVTIGASYATQVELAGGYGSTGVTVQADGDILTNGTLDLGGDDDTSTLTIHDAGSIVLYDDSDDTTVILGPVGDGTTVLGITGTVNATGYQAGGNAGMTTVITVRDSGGAADCTMTVTGGIITATTCSHT